MATDLTDIFGDEICVSPQPKQMERQFSGWPGANGVVGMKMGFRGKLFVVSGRLRAANSSYQTARSELQGDIDDIEAYCDLDDADYTYKGQTYTNVVFNRLRLLPGDRGKIFHWKGNEIFADFICYGLQLT